MNPNKLTIAALALALTATASSLGAAAAEIARAEFTADGKVKTPQGWRRWVYVGTPLTPNALNGGEAPFPEFHNVYVEPSAYEYFKNTGKWADGSQIAKELVRVRASENGNDQANGSSLEVSGRGYFMDDFAGLELAVKDSKRFAKEPGAWAYFSFGHQPEPYNETAAVLPVDTCNSCHAENAATDFVFTQFYPVLRAK